MTDILDKLPDEELTEEEHEVLLLRSEHAIAPPLSPAARAVLDAYRDADIDDGATAAAVLRAVADQAEIFFDAYDNPRQVVTVDDLLNIAAELEPLD